MCCRHCATCPVAAPEAVITAIAAAQPLSEPVSGVGEAETLGRVTVNIGHIAGGTSMNLIPASARAGVEAGQRCLLGRQETRQLSVWPQKTKHWQGFVRKRAEVIVMQPQPHQDVPRDFMAG